MSRTLFSESFQEKANYIRTSAVNLLRNYDLEYVLSNKKKNRVINDLLDECIYYTPIEILEDSITAELEHQTPSNQEDHFLSDYEAALSQWGEISRKLHIPYRTPARQEISIWERCCKKRSFGGK